MSQLQYNIVDIHTYSIVEEGAAEGRQISENYHFRKVHGPAEIKWPTLKKKNPPLQSYETELRRRMPIEVSSNFLVDLSHSENRKNHGANFLLST
ncbi:hypothetical protein EVAR_88019_1 [Eumeta japonica]|uniref:Uncharacterized protein n=1 Tax=Eumeta variegata TaxID=151549 RepID=A0A4C1VCU6_EUMVA|nr:hypothetical protein EVAR_88019_1 [Eumeta japonica]